MLANLVLDTTLLLTIKKPSKYDSVLVNILSSIVPPIMKLIRIVSTFSLVEI